MATDFTLPHSLNSLASQGLNIDQYFGLWAIHVDPFQAVVERWNGTNLQLHVGDPKSLAAAESQAKKSYAVTRDGVAVIPVSGPLMKAVSSMSDGTSLTYLRRQLGNAAADPDVVGILLGFDTPGGTTAGTADAAAAIDSAKARKPVYGYVEDRCCSAGVWLASRCDRVYANQPSAVYGSIGVYSTLVDASKRAEQLGVKVHVIRTGPLKGAGVPGDAVTPEQLAELQAYVDAVHAAFLDAIAGGRRMSVAQVQPFADGGIFTAAIAAQRGLIDGVRTYEAALAELVGVAAARKKQSAPAGARRMSTDNPAPVAATIAELKAACPGAPSDWLLSQIEAGATLAAAQTAFIGLQSKMLAEANAAAAKAAEDAKAKAGSGLGVAPPNRHHTTSSAASEAATEATGDPVADFHAAVRDAMKVSNCSRAAAVQSVIRAQPVLHAEYLKATNESKFHGQIDERRKQFERSRR